MPLLGEKAHRPLTAFLLSLAATLPAKPTAIVLITAHWEEPVVTVTLDSNYAKTAVMTRSSSSQSSIP